MSFDILGGRLDVLREQDFIRAAKRLSCEPAVIQAVCEVEAPHGGFLTDGRPVVLFEAHWFHKLTGGKFDESVPLLSSPVWDRSLYATGINENARQKAEWLRLRMALTLDRSAALQSASWGKFQIMGVNYLYCGFPTIQVFVNTMYSGESGQLDAFVALVLNRKWEKPLQDKDWAGFAQRYNGSDFRKNKYDTKLANAYSKLKGAA